ncbi:MAG: diguanylate cyclase [Terracidiphilus sp.]
MNDRCELLEAVLECLPQGIALMTAEGRLTLWNRAAEEITGYRAAELLGRQVPEGLEPLLMAWKQLGAGALSRPGATGRGALARLEHKLGQTLGAMTHALILRDGLGAQLGVAVLFHSTEDMDVLPRGECAGDEQVTESQAEMEERLQTVFADLVEGGPPFGLLWIAVDQSPELRKTHGAGACTAMLEKVERAVSNGLRTGEAMGRWGDDEFLVISHERSPAMLDEHARTLAGLARTADFRWWGDRITLTVSIGTAHSEPGQTLAGLLQSAKDAMLASFQAGGNQIAPAPGRKQCTPF